MKLTTRRLILKKPKISDWKDTVEGIGDLDVSKNLLTVSYPYSKKDALSWIKSNLRHKKNNYHFNIELKSEKKMIGAIGLKVDAHNKIGSTGSWINKNYWRKGFITEAKIAVNDFAFNKLKLRKLETNVFADNIASNAVQKNIGYKVEGKKIKSNICKATGKIHDDVIYGLLKEDWEKHRRILVKKLKKYTEERK